MLLFRVEAWPAADALAGLAPPVSGWCSRWALVNDLHFCWGAHLLGNANLTLNGTPLLCIFPIWAQDFPLTYRDVIPGILRFAPDGAPTRRAWGTVSSVAAPLLARAALSTDSSGGARLARVRLQVPQQLHRLLAALPRLRGSPLPP